MPRRTQVGVIFASIGALYSLNGPGLADADGLAAGFDPDREPGFAEFLGVASPVAGVADDATEVAGVGVPAA